MPRGGKRPGAGAPVGNFNGLTHGRYALRATLCYQVFHAYPRQAGIDLMREFRTMCLVPADRPIRRSDAGRMLRFLDKKWFDCIPRGQSDAINAQLQCRAVQVLGDAYNWDPAQIQAERERRRL